MAITLAFDCGLLEGQRESKLGIKALTSVDSKKVTSHSGPLNDIADALLRSTDVRPLWGPVHAASLLDNPPGKRFARELTCN